MTDDNVKKKPEKISDREIENARVGYQVAINLSIHEGQLIWSKFQALLIANSIILGSLGMVLIQFRLSNPPRFFMIGIPIVGLAVCLCWFPLLRRSFNQQHYWIFSAREVEETLLKKSLNILSRGGNFVDGKEVFLTIADKPKCLRMSCFVGKLSVQWISYCIIVLFCLMHIAALIWQ